MPKSSHFQLVRNPLQLPDSLRGSAVAIGNFDGFHRGHQKVLASMRDWAKQRGCPAIVLSFEPHPRDFFKRQAPLMRLTDENSKAILAKALSLDGLVILDFDDKLSQIQPEDFVRHILVEALGCTAVFVGANFRFGRSRAGDTDLLNDMGSRNGFECHPSALETDCRDVVSSSRVRAALSAGDVCDANGMLGFRWFFEAQARSSKPAQRRIEFKSHQVSALAEGEYGVRGVAGPWPIEGIGRVTREKPGVLDMYFPADMPAVTHETVRLSLLGNSGSSAREMIGLNHAMPLSDLDRAIGII